MTWKSGRVPDDWMKEVIVLLYKGKGKRNNCKNYRRISLLSIVSKVCKRIADDCVKMISDHVVD